MTARPGRIATLLTLAMALVTTAFTATRADAAGHDGLRAEGSGRDRSPAARRLTLEYQLPGGVAGIFLYGNGEIDGPGMGGVAFSTRPGELFVRVAVVDALGQGVFASVDQDSDGDFLADRIDVMPDPPGSGSAVMAVDSTSGRALMSTSVRNSTWTEVGDPRLGTLFSVWFSIAHGGGPTQAVVANEKGTFAYGGNGNWTDIVPTY